MPEGLVEQLQRYERDDLLELVSAPAFVAGARVKVTEGPFRSFIAKVLSTDEKGRVWLLLDCMGQMVRAQFDAWSLEH
jgi:transcription antitermination factor NusG